MNHKSLNVLAIACVLMVPVVCVHAQETVKLAPISESERAVLRNLPDWKLTTKAYQEEAVRLMLKEVNRVAALLPLGERLPIRDADLIGRYVNPPVMGALGLVTTSNFNYTFDRKLCSLTRRDMVARFYEAKAKYSWPMDRMNTNRVFQIATELMEAMNVDVAGLNRDCTIEITTPETEGLFRKHFFPHYWVNWLNKKEDRAVAYVEFIVPTKYILQIAVRNTGYILREPIAIPNLAALLNQTNAPTTP